MGNPVVYSFHEQFFLLEVEKAVHVLRTGATLDFALLPPTLIPYY